MGFLEDGESHDNLITPGGRLSIFAEHFGPEEEGRVLLEGDFASVAVPAADTDWGVGGGQFFDESIQIRVPDASAFAPLSGPLVRVRVERADGGMSRPHGLGWAFEQRDLRADEVEVVECGRDGNADLCNGVSERDGCPLEDIAAFWDEYAAPGHPMQLGHMDLTLRQYEGIRPEGPWPREPAIYGVHSNCVGAIGNDAGVDRYRIGPLANLWRIRATRWSDLDDVEGDADLMSDHPSAGADGWDPIEVDWEVTPADSIAYAIWVAVEGPGGFPVR